MCLLFGKCTRWDAKNTDNISPFYSATVLFLLLSLVVVFFVSPKSLGEPPNEFNMEAFEESIQKLSEKGFDKDRLIQMTKTMGSYGFKRTEIEKIHRLYLNLLNEGSYSKGYEEKLYEGMVKKIPPKMIIGALYMIRKRMDHAGKSLNTFGFRKTIHLSMTQTLFDSLTAGLNFSDEKILIKGLEKRVSDIEQYERSEIVEESLVTVRKMLRTGVSSSVVATIITKALAQNYVAREIAALREAFERQLKVKDPVSAASDLFKQVRRGQKPGSPSGKGESSNGSGSGSKNKGKGKGGNNGGNQGKGKGKNKP